MQSRGIKGLLSSLRINYADYVGFAPELLALVFSIVYLHLIYYRFRETWCPMSKVIAATPSSCAVLLTYTAYLLKSDIII